ncbi:MAG: hypothetical protein ACUVSF_13515 [Anaerolineae bacterium]
MSRRRSSLSQATSYRAIARFWDAHDLAEHWEETRLQEFEVTYRVGITYVALKSSLAAMLNEVARRREVAPETLLNAWVRDRLLDEMSDLESDET